MNYSEAVAWVEGFQKFGIKLGLNRMKTVLNTLNNPHKKSKFIHVAGTNGKGSVCRYISSILSREQYKTGLYLSPHLVDFRERFQINNKYISKKKLVDIVKRIRPIIEEYAERDVQLTYFEICTIISFVFFADEKVDYAVVEVGLGGKYDATNVITPLISVITNVRLDHQNRLGDSIQVIAHEKAGVIKPNIPVVTAAEGQGLSVIQQSCKKKNASLTVVSRENINIQISNFSHQTLFISGFFDDYLVTTHQPGTYQPINVALSISAIESLQKRGVFITKESISKGIKEMVHPGRMQVLQKCPFVVVDGAHNPDAMHYVVESVKKLFQYNRLIVIFGVMKDKSIDEMLKILLPIVDIIIVTEPKHTRSASKKDIVKSILQINDSKIIYQTSSVKNAYHKALELGDKKDLILGTGSLFTVAELLQIQPKC